MSVEVTTCSTSAAAPTGTIRYWAAARAAAGADEEAVTAATLAEALRVVVSRRPDGASLEAVLGVCSYIVDGTPVGRRPHDTVELGSDGWTVEALPPFAGG